MLKTVGLHQVVKRSIWENINLLGSLINIKSLQDINCIRRQRDSKFLSEHSYSSSRSGNDVECISYFRSLEAQNFTFKSKVLIPSSNFNMDCVLNFPLSKTNEESHQGVPYLQELEKYSFPSVTTILNKTMSPENWAVLERWKKKMIAEMGEEGFKKYQKDIFSNGSALHQCIKDYLLGTPENKLILKEEITGHWNSLKTVLPAINDVKILEKPVSHPYLFYRGIVDCVATYRNQLVVIDWKTSKKHKRTVESIYDNPVQVAAYVGALNFDSSYEMKIDSALVVVVYENGDPGDVHYITRPLCHIFWKEWVKRLKLYWEIMNKS